MINYDLDGDYEVAKRKLDEIYTTRIEYLGTSSGVGAHSLLHYSHFDYDELNQIGNDVDDNDYSEDEDLFEIGEKLLSISPSIIFSYDSNSDHYFNHRILCTKTGKTYEISIAGQKLLELCDGSSFINDIISKWVKDQDNGLGLEIIHISRAHTLIKEFINKELVIVE